MPKRIRMKKVLSYTVAASLESNLTTSAKTQNVHVLHSNNPIPEIRLI